ncbi:MAG: right-handed parallel beta-helix repeat-containing protein, partial [Candidatus Thermoplasmatota archaeon]|nr:right-handed parallel beta-helix repeat-containing protein [Candidatus Thermoplasmatota archaeon]
MKEKNKIFKRLVIFTIAVTMFLAAFLLLPTTSAADHYVNPGDDIQAVINAGGNYDTIYFAAGTYNPTATITINKPLTLLGPQSGVDPRPFVGSTRNPGDILAEAIIDGNGIYQIFYIDADDVIIDGLEVCNGSGDLIRQSNAHSGTIIRNCIVHDAIDDEGIQLASCTNGIIENNYIYDLAQDGASFAASTNCAIRDNEITTSNSENGAIFVYDSSDITIEGNYVHHTSANNGIKLYTNIGDIDIINNLISENEWEIK